MVCSVLLSIETYYSPLRQPYRKGCFAQVRWGWKSLTDLRSLHQQRSKLKWNMLYIFVPFSQFHNAITIFIYLNPKRILKSSSNVTSSTKLPDCSYSELPKHFVCTLFMATTCKFLSLICLYLLDSNLH